VAGGTASVLTGGKFANGAITAAFAHLFNAEAHGCGARGACGSVGGAPSLGETMQAVGNIAWAVAPGTAFVDCIAGSCTAGAWGPAVLDFLPGEGKVFGLLGKVCSFDGDTKVETKRGRVAIKDIKPGEDEVLARDEKTGKMAWKRASARFLNHDPDTTRLTILDRATGATQTIITTSNHPFYVADAAIPEVRLVANGGVAEVGTTASGRWVEAGRLAQGARLINSAGGFSEVVSVEVEDKPIDAYNLSVDAFHTFFVAAPGIDNAPAVWVHNACPYWPKLASEMDEFLGVAGKKIPDGPMTPGRDKVVWTPNGSTKITLEQHPYHPNAPDWHRDSHWHLDTPGSPHQRYLPGDKMPGY
jgi:Pretoxin HINT domain